MAMQIMKHRISILLSPRILLLSGETMEQLLFSKILILPFRIPPLKLNGTMEHHLPFSRVLILLKIKLQCNPVLPMPPLPEEAAWCLQETRQKTTSL
jgi:hypothetical protein